MFRVAVVTVAVILLTTVSARAADATTSSEPQSGPLSAAIARAAKDASPDLPAWAADRSERRPALLPALYGSYAVLQALDAYSTKRAMTAGAREANPLMRAGGSTGAIAVKAAAGAATIFFAERAWKKNRVGAMVLMTALNGMTAAVVAHNIHNAARR
jgi:hypothetical protein